MKTIEIIVAGKIATPVGSPFIVCGNSDYVIEFTFDEEWDEYVQKTARFKYVKDGVEQYNDVVFNGTVCAVPVLEDIYEVKIGVFSGLLETTTPARVECKKSILCGDGSVPMPTTDVYNQLISAINTGLVKGAKGDTGERGVSGVYVGAGDMPDGYDIQIDTDEDATVIDQTYKPTSTNPQSGVAVASAIAQSVGNIEILLSKI